MCELIIHKNPRGFGQREADDPRKTDFELLQVSPRGTSFTHSSTSKHQNVTCDSIKRRKATCGDQDKLRRLVGRRSTFDCTGD